LGIFLARVADVGVIPHGGSFEARETKSIILSLPKA